MNSFEIHVPEQPASPPLPEDGHDSLVRIADEIAALHEKDLAPININIPRACAIALGAIPKIRELRPAVLEVFRAFPIEALDKIEDYTLALNYAHLMTAPRVQNNEQIKAAYRAVLAQRAELLLHADVLAARGYFEREMLAEVEVRRGAGYLDAANDLIALSLMFRQSWSVVGNKTAVEQEDCRRADRLGRELVLLAGRKLTPVAAEGLSMSQVVDRRARCFTLFVRAYDRCRQAAVCLRWDEGDADELVPSIFRKHRGRRRAAAEDAGIESETPAGSDGAGEEEARQRSGERAESPR